MAYPTLEQYNEALQHPAAALVDPVLKHGSVAMSGLGLPRALCGGFALTYSVSAGGHKYAVRCFHKKSDSLERRYAEIATRLTALRSPYFIDCQFQPQGVRVNGSIYPVVKMSWAAGVTLGEFVESNVRNASALQALVGALRNLAAFLETHGIAHGDIQPGNVMVDSAGSVVRLIDYDGMYVEPLRSLGSTELGQRNFQHPGRTSAAWDAKLDRFSFICLDLALRAIAAHPDLWASTKSDGDAFLFRANDFADPDASTIFQSLLARVQFAEDVRALAAICSVPFGRVPSLGDFLAKRNIPQVAITTRAPTAALRYLSAYQVVNGASYDECLEAVGERVELIGLIVDVHYGKTTTGRDRGKTYAFVNFGPWKGRCVKLTVWPSELSRMTAKPDGSWTGRWVSVVGLMQPPYDSRKFNYSHLSISIEAGTQLTFLNEQEARFRLGGTATRPTTPPSRSSNIEVLERMTTRPGVTTKPTPRQTPRWQPAPSRSANQAVLDRMKTSHPSSSTGRPPQRPTHRSQAPGRPTSTPSSSNCFIATAIYGPDASQTQVLRSWRDRALLSYFLGRMLVRVYYAVSPHIVPLLARSRMLRAAVESGLDALVRRVGQTNQPSPRR